MGSGKLPAVETNSPKRLYYIDILNILSCFAVVVLHCSGGVFYYQKHAFGLYICFCRP